MFFSNKTIMNHELWIFQFRKYIRKKKKKNGGGGKKKLRVSPCHFRFSSLPPLGPLRPSTRGAVCAAEASRGSPPESQEAPEGLFMEVGRWVLVNKKRFRNISLVWFFLKDRFSWLTKVKRKCFYRSLWCVLKKKIE